MKEREILINDGIEYLSDEKLNFKLPPNCIFDKGKVGCGGTSVAIESDKPYIICVPFVSLIENKLEQYNNQINKRRTEEIYGFYSESNLKRDLVAYLDKVEVPKIIVTYDSLKKLSKWINPKDYYLLVDELHLLFTEYSYRSEAIKDVLDIYSEFKEYCFMTATPLEDDFILDELIHLPVYKAIWNNVKTVNVESIRVDGKVKAAVVNLVNNFLSNNYAENAYFFVNSVSYIKDIVSICNLTDENARAIYSKGNKTEVGIKRSSTISSPKKINFITSTAFEGSDLYDEDGITFVISDSSQSQTLVDISTKFQQIAGRIRNSKYSGKIYHIYKHTRYSDLSYTEFRDYINQTIDDTKKFVEKNNGESYLNKIKDNVLDNFYLRKVGTELIFDPNKVKMDHYNFKIIREIYSLRINLDKEYKKYNFDVEHFDFTPEEINEMSRTVTNFKDVVLEVQEEMKLINDYEYYFESDVIVEAYKKYPFLEKAIKILGFEGIEKSDYDISNIKDKLIRREDLGLEAKILKSLNDKFNPVNGDFYKASEIKRIFTNIYSGLGIKATAKGTDLLKYYNVKETSKRIDGTNYKGFIILGKKIIIKE